MSDQQRLGRPTACPGLSIRRPVVFWAVIASNVAMWIGLWAILRPLVFA